MPLRRDLALLREGSVGPLRGCDMGNAAALCGGGSSPQVIHSWFVGVRRACPTRPTENTVCFHAMQLIHTASAPGDGVVT